MYNCFCSEALEAISSTATHVNETIRQMVSGSYGAPTVCFDVLHTPECIG